MIEDSCLSRGLLASARCRRVVAAVALLQPVQLLHMERVPAEVQLADILAVVAVVLESRAAVATAAAVGDSYWSMRRRRSTAVAAVVAAAGTRRLAAVPCSLTCSTRTVGGGVEPAVAAAIVEAVAASSSSTQHTLQMMLGKIVDGVVVAPADTVEAVPSSSLSTWMAVVVELASASLPWWTAQVHKP